MSVTTVASQVPVQPTTMPARRVQLIGPKLVVVGSINPVKVEATRQAFSALWPHDKWRVSGIDVPSGVPAQPMIRGEGVTGATNRAQRALEQLPLADLAVGIEEYLDYDRDLGWNTTACIVVIDQSDQQPTGFRQVIGFSPSLPVPDKLMKLVRAGHELGMACDLLFRQSDSKRAGGVHGLLTNGALTRQQVHQVGVICALSRLLD